MDNDYEARLKEVIERQKWEIAGLKDEIRSAAVTIRGLAANLDQRLTSTLTHDPGQPGLLVRDLGLSARCMNALLNMGCVSVQDVTNMREHELLSVHNFGKKLLKELKDELATYSLKLTD